jgi:hypothetical protein
MSGSTVNAIVFFVVVGGVLGFLGWYFVRYVAGRRRISSGLRALALVNYEYLQNAVGKKAVQEILYTEQAWQEEDDQGDPPEK